MRKLSRKWFVWWTIIAFALPGWYLFHRIISYPGTFNGVEFFSRIVGAALVSGIAWIIYGIACACSRKIECPKCGGENIAKYLYGITKMTNAIERNCAAGKIVLGGGGTRKARPKWFCNNCQHEW